MVDPAADPVAAASALVARLAGEDRAGWGPSARSQRVRDLFALKEHTDAALLAEVAEWDAGKDWALDGQLSAPTWLAWQAPLTKATAGRVVADAEFLRRHGDIAALLVAGELSCAHVTAMAKAAKHHETEFDICKESLVGSARQMNPTDFAAVMPSPSAHRRWRCWPPAGARCRRLGGIPLASELTAQGATLDSADAVAYVAAEAALALDRDGGRTFAHFR